MKGVIFTEMVAFLEDRFGVVRADDILVAARLPNDGAFTSVGNYPSTQAIAIMVAAAELTADDVHRLCQDYGSWLFNRFGVLFPSIMARYASAEALLDHVGSHIHEEVRVLYPDARPPLISTRHDGADIIVSYESHRPMAHIAYGLIRRSLVAYGDPRQVHWTPSSDATSARFVISAVSAPA